MNDRVALGIFVLGIGILLFLLPILFGVVLFILPGIIILLGIIIILNKKEDIIEERKDKE
jgi:hypothetical protein